MTREDIAKLSDEEANVLIAKILGWMEGTTGLWKDPDKTGYYRPPSYCSDLNAINSAIRSLPHLLLEQFPTALGRVLFGATTNENDWIVYQMVSALPRPLAEAFLQTKQTK